MTLFAKYSEMSCDNSLDERCPEGGRRIVLQGSHKAIVGGLMDLKKGKLTNEVLAYAGFRGIGHV